MSQVYGLSQIDATAVTADVGGTTYDASVPPKSPIAAQTTVDWLTALGFGVTAGSTRWTKYFDTSAYTLVVETSGNGTIDYGPSIAVRRNTITNLLDLENLVVLECVNLLLMQGYAPSSIVLEKSYQLGRNPGGFLDILVMNGPRAYLMIECKTAGPEFSKELNRLRSIADSQLLSYSFQDQNAEQAVLYSSTVDSPVGGTPTIRREYAGFSTSILEGKNLAEYFDSWDKEVYTNGLESAAPYTLDTKRLRIRDLVDMTQEDGAILFNGFQEILRRHAVSDKPNAFNKIFNLFICKVLDEDKANADEETDFQWLPAESATDVLETLSTLYADGMMKYLSLETKDSAVELEQVIGGLDGDVRDQIRQLFATSRQLKNTDFAFIDVVDEITFNQNALIVRDIVRLLQKKRLRYTEKHGFMGMFFEKLLNTSMKQESGQFFTPPPIAQFVNEALPIEEIVAKKIRERRNDFLPYAIDYAAGSGHFLTEYMDRVDKVLQSIDDGAYPSQDQRGNAAHWKYALKWAEVFVYGVELDYRLAKAAKVSTFLNGDGTAHVIRGNGLGSFELDPNYRNDGGILARAPQGNSGAGYARDHARFDVVVANPPYSVSEFISGVEHAADSFELAQHIPATSDKIETLFVERTKQLLVDNGVAGLILPTSLLSNDGLEASARRLLLRHFDVIAIVALGGHVFSATTTPTSIVFLRRIPNSVSEALRAGVKKFFERGIDSTMNKVAKGIETYAQELYGVSLKDYNDAITDPLNSGLDFAAEYEWEYVNNGNARNRSARTVATPSTPSKATPAFLKFLRTNEAERIEAFFLTRGKEVLQVTSPASTRDEKAFLGYKFSDRKKQSGISLLSDTGLIDTPLFDPSSHDNPDKISTLIKRLFTAPTTPVPATLAGFAEKIPATDLVGLTTPIFRWGLTGRSSTPTRFAVPTKRLGEVAHIAIGGTPSRTKPAYFNGTNLWASIRDLNGGTITRTNEHISDAAIGKSSVKLVKRGSLLLSFKLTIGRTAIAGADLYTNEAIAAIVPRPAPSGQTEWVDTDYLHVLFEYLSDDLLKHTSAGQKKIGTSLQIADLRRALVPVLDATQRANIVTIGRDIALTAEQKRDSIRALLWAPPATTP